MQTRYIPATVMLLAGTVASIMSIINKFQLLYTLELVLAVLIIFYIVGIIAKKIVEFAFRTKPVEEVQETEAEEENLNSEQESEAVE